MSYGTRVQFEEMRSETGANIGAGAGGYVAVGTPLNFPCRLIVLVNNTDANLFISFANPGVTAAAAVDHLFLLAGGQVVLDFASDRVQQNTFALCTDTQVYAAGAAATSGTLYVSPVFALGD